MDNNITESEYVGWAVMADERAPIDGIVELSGWEKICTTTKNKFRLAVKEVDLIIVGNVKSGYRSDAPIICAVITHEDESFSEVNDTYLAIHLKLILCTINHHSRR